jgi:two-component system, LytTR family, sensor kinase
MAAPDPSERRRHVQRFLLVLSAWTAVSVIFGLILSLQVRLPLRYSFVSSFAWYYSVGVIVWIACVADRRLGLWRRPLTSALLIRGAIALAALTVWTVFIVGWSRWTVGPNFWEFVFADAWMFQLASTAFVYAAGVGVGLVVQSGDRAREREQRELHLQVLARDAELTAIKAQLRPHFLFNALNSILALMEHDPAEARQMLLRLSSLLHSVFDRLDEPLVPLDRELEIVRDYLDIERIRFGDRMSFSIDADAAAKTVPVPPFLLQPIVENAVKHGIEPFARQGSVRVRGQLEGQRLRLSVADSGPGINGAAMVRPSHGRGMALTVRRLQTVYGSDRATLSTARDADGFVVTLDLPLDSNAG